MKPPLIAREGWPILALLGGVTAALYLAVPWLSLLPLVLFALVAYFFRDPERGVPGDPGLVVAPADGRVMFVREVAEPRFLGGRARVVSIFLSVLDVHINRAPVAGRVAYKEYVPGRFVAAWANQAEEINERLYLGLEAGPHRVLVVQIAGLIARRIVCRSGVGDGLERGERFGMIKFGSCTRLYLPLEAAIAVRPGDHVKGGETVIGRLPA